MVNKSSLSLICHIPSSIVLSALAVLFGPSPREVKANTWNSCLVHLSSPETSLLNSVPFFVIEVFAAPPDPFFVWNSLNPSILQCLPIACGNCQEAVMLVEELAVNVKLVGGFDGTERNKKRPRMLHQKCWLYLNTRLIFLVWWVWRCDSWYEPMGFVDMATT